MAPNPFAKPPTTVAPVSAKPPAGPTGRSAKPKPIADAPKATQPRHRMGGSTGGGEYVTNHHRSFRNK